MSPPSLLTSILRAIKDLARRWEEVAPAIQVDIDEGDDVSFRSIWEMSEAQLKRHYGGFAEAAAAVFRYAVISLKIRAWVADGPDWKRPTIHTIRTSLPPSGELIVDQEEVHRVFEFRWPGAYPPAFNAEPFPKPAKRKVGRPTGPGYALTDVRTFKRILKAQRKSGDVRTEHFWVNKFAGKPNAPDFSSNVDRLRKGLPNWLKEIGEQWRRSN